MSFILIRCLVSWFLSSHVIPLPSCIHAIRRVLRGATQNGQCMTSKYRESDKRADGSYAFEWLSRYFDVIH